MALVQLTEKKSSSQLDAVSPESPNGDEEIDRKAQADMLARGKDVTSVPYHPDPDLSKKAASLQKEYDQAVFEMICLSIKLPEGALFGSSWRSWSAILERESDNSKFTKFLHHVLPRIFPYNGDAYIAFQHLGRVHARLYGSVDDDYCERNKARYSAAVSIRFVIGCRSPEALETILSTRIHRGEREASSVARENKCVNLPAGQKVSIEETKWFNGYAVARIKPVPQTGVDYWIADRDAFKVAIDAAQGP